MTDTAWQDDLAYIEQQGLTRSSLLDLKDRFQRRTDQIATRLQLTEEQLREIIRFGDHTGEIPEKILGMAIVQGETGPLLSR